VQLSPSADSPAIPGRAGLPPPVTLRAIRFNLAMPLSRRSFVARLLASPLAGSYAAAAQTAAPSKITRIETV